MGAFLDINSYENLINEKISNMKKWLGIIALHSIVIVGTSQKSIDTGSDILYQTQLKTAEAFFRLDQIGEAKKILDMVISGSRGWEWKLLYARIDRSVYTLKAHAKAVVGLAVSKDGKWIASGSADQKIMIWDAKTYQVKKILEGHKGQVTTLDFSPDTKWLVSGSTDKTLRLWSVEEGKEIKNFNTEFSQGIYQAKFSPSGKQIGVVSWEFKQGFGVQGFAKILDTEAGILIRRIDTDVKPATSIDFTPDGKKIITGTWNFVVRQHDIGTGATIDLHDLSKLPYYTAIQSVAYSRDGSMIIESGKDDRIRLMDAEGKLIKQIEPWEGHRHWINSVRFSPDGQYFASASEDGLLMVWNTKSTERIFTFKGHTAGLNQLEWHPDGKRIITSSSDGTLKVWDITQPGERVFTVADNETGPWYAPVTPDGKKMVSASSTRALSVWNLDDGKQLRLLDSTTNNAAIINDDGSFIAAAGSAKNLVGFGLEKIYSSPGHTGSVFGMSFHQRKKTIATAGDRTLRIWDASNGILQQVIPTYSGVYAVGFSADGRWLAAGCNDGKLKIYSTENWQITDSVQCGAGLRYITAHANGKYLVAVGELSDVFVYDLETQKILHELKGHTKTVYGAATHPTLPLAITVGYDKTARVWNLETGVNTLTLYGFTGELFTTSIVDQGRRLVLTETSGKVHVIDL